MYIVYCVYTSYEVIVHYMMCTTCMHIILMSTCTLYHTQVDWNEVFGCPGSVKFHISWLYPTPVRFPGAVKDLILGYTVRDPSSYDHHSRHSSRTGSGSSGGSPRLLDSGGKDASEGEEEGADERAPLRGSSYHSKTGSGTGGGMIGMYILLSVYSMYSVCIYAEYICLPRIHM